MARTGRPPRPLAERFMAKVGEIDANGCRPWMGARHTQGYGLIKRKDGAQLRANRVAYELTHGPIPEGLHVCHACDNPWCVEASHLFLGTPRENNDDKIRKGRLVSSPGESNGQAKLRAADVVVIRSLGGRQRDIATAYGVCQTTVSLIKRGKRWPALPA